MDFLQNIDLVTLFFLVAGFIVALSVHEASHALVADRLGDPTPRLAGRLTLNPKAHYDPLGTSLLIFLLIMSVAGLSRFVFGWGKPVPFDPYNLKNPKRDSALISLAGPTANFITAIIFALPYHIGRFLNIPDLAIFASPAGPLAGVVFLNIVLGVFNLIPIHPLDGFKVVAGILPKQWYYDWMRMQEYSQMFFFILLIFLFFIPVIPTILGPLVINIFNFVYLNF